MKNLTVVCDQLGKEALAACLEYEQFDVSGDFCFPWEEEVRKICMRTCANCTEAARTLRSQCRFQLQVLTNGPLMTKYCSQTYDSMELHRCPALTMVTEEQCQSEEAKECMLECGNFGECMCRDRKGTATGPVCAGSTRVLEFPENPGYIYTCDKTPWKCMHHKATKCGKYKYCPPDYCIIKRVQCIPQEDCLMFDVCDPGSGLCYFKYRPNGYGCDDGLFYTLNDSCDDGLCRGITDNCVRYGVNCTPYSPCITNGYCHSFSGRCTFDRLPDGTLCDDGRPFTLEDRCQGGSCIGKPVDLCVERGIVCEVPNSCYDPGICDKTTGVCSDAVAARDSRPCDDRDPATEDDRCIDGVCLGRLAVAEQFQTLGTGECTDREGLRMSRYSGDVGDEPECLRVCEEDPQCAAYSFAFPLCSIYGTVRTREPVSSRQWSFQEGSTNPKAIAVELAALTATGQRESICRRKGRRSDALVDFGAGSEFRNEDFFEPWKVGLFCGLAVLIFFSWPMARALGRCCSREESTTRVSSAFLDPTIEAQRAQLDGDFDAQWDQLRATAADAEGDTVLTEPATLYPPSPGDHPTLQPSQLDEPGLFNAPTAPGEVPAPEPSGAGALPSDRRAS